MIYLKVGLYLVIIATSVIIFKNRPSKRSLIKKLDEIEAEPKIVLSSFNRSESRTTSFDDRLGNLVIQSDLQLIQLDEFGSLQLKISSEYQGNLIKGEFWTVIDPNILGINSDISGSTSDELIILSRNIHESRTLNILAENYDIGFIPSRQCDGLVVPITEVKPGRTTKQFILSGVFQDGGRWSIFVDYERFKVEVKGNLSSLQKEGNFKLYFSN